MMWLWILAISIALGLFNFFMPFSLLTSALLLIPQVGIALAGGCIFYILEMKPPYAGDFTWRWGSSESLCEGCDNWFHMDRYFLYLDVTSRG